MQIFKGLWGALVMILVGIAPVNAQAFPLKGTNVAVYFSKKYFSFDENYRIPLSQFIKSDLGENAEIEDIKTQTLVALGTMFSEQLRAPCQADSTFFLNEIPSLGGEFMRKYNAEEGLLEPLGAAFAGIDYVLVVNPLVLGSYKTSSVYSRSNRIITEQIVVKTARMNMDLFDTRSGARKSSFETCIDERKSHPRHLLFEFHMQSSRTGRFLARLFSLAVDNMNTGILTNCEGEG
ncbi:MAG: hypothetical protein RLZZ165_1726 [Bacteroidota bacterium]|jgi:hypothetical protein